MHLEVAKDFGVSQGALKPRKTSMPERRPIKLSRIVSGSISTVFPRMSTLLSAEWSKATEFAGPSRALSVAFWSRKCRMGTARAGNTDNSVI